MFSWSAATRRAANGYPAARLNNSSSTPVVAQTIQGSIRPPDYSRSQHLESYLKDATLQRSTRPVGSDQSTYDTVFQTVQGHTLILRVHVPPLSHSTAACRAPSMTLVGVRASHPWLDARMKVIGYSNISSDEVWRNSRVLLGDAVHAVVKHFQLNPPTSIEVTDAALRSIQSASASSSTGTPQPPAVESSTSNASDEPPGYETLLEVPDVEMPPIPLQFDSLDGLSREELEKLLDDNLAFIAFCNRLPFVDSLRTISNNILEDNVETAYKTLEREDELKALYEEVKELKSSLERKVQAFEKLEKEQDARAAPPDKMDVIKKLTRAKQEAFDESETLADEWADEGGHVDTFLSEFLKTRKIHHIRAAKVELLQQNKLI